MDTLSNCLNKHKPRLVGGVACFLAKELLNLDHERVFIEQFAVIFSKRIVGFDINFIDTLYYARTERD